MSSQQPIKLAILGASGRMGTQVAKLARPMSSGFEIVAEWSGGAALGDELQAADVAIDFTPATATDDIVAALSGTTCALVSGTTGRSAQQTAAVEDQSATQRVFLASNMSPVVHLLSMLVEQAARALPELDIEIAETHHHGKLDAPSGTAITLGGAAARGRGVTQPEVRLRAGGARESGEIGFSVRRGGNVIGEHDVTMFGEFERLTLSHRAEDRSLFAAGALRAAAWLIDQPPGLYGMQDLLAGGD
ncbi:MAG: 4-hydroxy-tetrahydrodipicolinate reductase [Pseudomonadota bacterium]